MHRRVNRVVFNPTRIRWIFRIDLFENETSRNKILFHIFDLLLHEESLFDFTLYLICSNVKSRSRNSYVYYISRASLLILILLDYLFYLSSMCVISKGCVSINLWRTLHKFAVTVNSVSGQLCVNSAKCVYIN